MALRVRVDSRCLGLGDRGMRSRAGEEVYSDFLSNPWAPFIYPMYKVTIQRRK
jgi:hypothetical protein